MEKVLIVGCKKTMNDVCIACSKCTVAFNRKDGEFSRYKDGDAELIGMLNCGDCPGAAIVPRLAQVKVWTKPMDEKVTKVHISNCIVDFCPYKDAIIDKVKELSGVEVILGTHPYKPENIFA